ncbi:probable leucine-rich repeat receptor-like protein kinase At5g49770 isoform X2 [Phoenix dactylifera]|uniref:non-specific serine/threonine protein kinase n=1 Tax=Phoenix dactylifera TaxID=42345 RepID=A0A8B9ATJ4_PHODC|nr:probable leucine-rich repeat receptor-like protein kinase At5g49770 isoform X2 [Phoenix dactylifera]
MGTELLLLLVFVAGLRVSYGTTDPTDAAALRSLMDTWQNTPPSWGQSDDPCGTPWEGVGCRNSRVTILKLSTMGLKGTLSGDIGQLSELQSLDLSYNKELGGQLTENIGNLKKLTTLILAGCSFSGKIPDEIGDLGKLSYLALNSNKFTGTIPASLGTLSNLYWLDVADNQLTGPIPISNNRAPGLDQLLHTKHFHFNKNQLSGPIPEQLFSLNMSLIHILFDGNQLTGEIPASIGLVKSLEVLRLDRNFLKGSVPSNINSLTNINELNLANNQLSGPMPNLTGMNSLNYVDLSNNTFDSSESPAWFSQIESLTALVIQSGRLYGQVPEKLFSFPQLQQVILDDNKFNGTLAMGNSISQQLQIVSFKNNALDSVALHPGYDMTLILAGNPVCNNQLSDTTYCSLQQKQSLPYSTSLANCGPKQCPPDQSLSPSKCNCAYPYEGVMFFRGPRFRDLTDSTLFQELERTMWIKLGLEPGSVFLKNPFFSGDSYLQLQVKLFPSDGMYFNRSEILRIGFDLSNQTYKPPKSFGPYYFIASPYPFPDVEGRSSMSPGLITGISVGCALLVLGLVGAGVYALRQKKRAQRAMELSKPFASWTRSGEDSGGAPQLKGARWFSFDELKKSTDNFSETNQIGSGGYGKVYRGLLSSGQLVAIKRAQEGSKQGALEFKTEVELLSRVHHKNLVTLVGFCFEQEEQMLVYEFMPNGTLRESLSGKSGIKLDWKRRLRIALGSARGLAYLHELADPPIIHRDVKPSNILLDENFTAKVADFGLSKLVPDSEQGHVTTQVKGTLGYLDPDYYMTQQLTEKSDVYSFGVVMLELVTARQPLKKGKYIVREVEMAINKNDEEYYGLKEIIDPIIQNTTYLIAFRQFIELAMCCVKESAADRPTMSNVVKEIEMMLHNDGLDTNSTSASSSATDIGKTKGDPRHPYNDSFLRKDVSSSAFEYSGGYSPSANPEPK